MKAEIISVGTELLLGHTVNTDATHVARELSFLALICCRCTPWVIIRNGSSPARSP